MRTMPWMVGIVGAAGVVLGGVAGAQPVPDYDFDWATIGDPGNRPANPIEAPVFASNNPPTLAGAVDYEYRLTRTETTAGDWMEYVQAYWPYQEGSINLLSFTGRWIRASNPNAQPGEDPGYHFSRPGAEQFPTTMSWYHAARFTNWLHNGKVNERWAFENGAYDTATFGGVDADGNPTDQFTHNPDAKFWIPSFDEWLKGMYWDPAKDGGAGGYWQMPNSSDVVSISGDPALGGETNAGLFDFPSGFVPDFLAAESYPSVQSPWGLLDGSGGASEWSEDRTLDLFSDARIHAGSWAFFEFYELDDRIDRRGTSSPGSTEGLRLASAIPAPSPLVGLAVVFAGYSTRRRR